MGSLAETSWRIKSIANMASLGSELVSSSTSTLPPLPTRSPLRLSATMRASALEDTAILPPIPGSFPVHTLDLNFKSTPFVSPSPESPLTDPTDDEPDSPSPPPPPQSQPPPNPMTKRHHALQELLSSERAYASDLALICDVHIPLALGKSSCTTLFH